MNAGAPARLKWYPPECGHTFWQAPIEFAVIVGATGIFVTVVAGNLSYDSLI